jgi:hypothetical protein
MTRRPQRTAAPKKAKRIIASKRKVIAALDDEFFGEVIGVAQAIGELRKALSQLSTSLDRGEFEKASAIGYGAVARSNTKETGRHARRFARSSTR